MANVGTNDIVEKMGINETEVTIDSSGCTTSEIPGVVVVMGHGCIGVLEEGNSNCENMLVSGN